MLRKLCIILIYVFVGIIVLGGIVPWLLNIGNWLAFGSGVVLMVGTILWLFLRIIRTITIHPSTDERKDNTYFGRDTDIF